MWIMGQYVMSALDATVCNNSLWKGKNGTPSKYVEKPITFGAEEKTEENAPLTEEEKRRQTEQLFMRLKIMGANHKRSNKSKDSTVSQPTVFLPAIQQDESSR